MDSRSFDAPWGSMLRVTSIAVVAICLGVAGLVLTQVPHPKLRWLGLLSALIPVFSAPFAIRRFELHDRRLLVRRLFWTTTIDLSELESVEIDPEATRRSVRLAGNGGAFCFCGWFRNSHLGVFRLYGNDLSLSVVLRFRDKRVVITPDTPERFVEAVRKTLDVKVAEGSKMSGR